MTMRQWIMGAVAGMVLAGPVLAEDEFYLVKIINYDRDRSMVTMSATEFKALEKTLKYEEKYFTKVMGDIAKDWRADELNKGIPFPGGRLAPRTIMSAQEFPSQEKADAQLMRYEDQEAKKAERNAKIKKKPQAKAKIKAEAARDAELARVADLVKAKMNDYLVKAGVAEEKKAK